VQGVEVAPARLAVRLPAVVSLTWSSSTSSPEKSAGQLPDSPKAPEQQRGPLVDWRRRSLQAEALSRAGGVLRRGGNVGEAVCRFGRQRPMAHD
jgi:hypothetical protein